MSNVLRLEEYRTTIRLDEQQHITNVDRWSGLIQPVLQALNVSVPHETPSAEALRILHGVLASIDPYVLSDDLLDEIEIIAAANNHAPLPVEANDLPSIASHYVTRYPARARTSIWIGDITRLRVDAIVNAANSLLLGCRIPNHACIDNAIHSAAGLRLRNDCATIIEQQAAREPTGCAKITRGYALPANYVLHTVGPQLRADYEPSTEQQQQLINAYHSCLDLASEVESIRSVAFCAISTGVFGYPKRKAAGVALTTVANWIRSHPNRFDQVIFNLYSTADVTEYEELLHDW